MVNPVVLAYLRTYRSKYDLKKLRAKILSSSYSEKDYDDALEELDKEDRSVASKFSKGEPAPKIPLKKESPTESSKYKLFGKKKYQVSKFSKKKYTSQIPFFSFFPDTYGKGSKTSKLSEGEGHSPDKFGKETKTSKPSTDESHSPDKFGKESKTSKHSIKENPLPDSNMPKAPSDRKALENKLIKVSAIIGFILSFSIILSVAMSYTDISFGGETLEFGVLVLQMFLLCFFLCGFLIIGKNNKLKWLKISSLLFGVFILLSLLGILLIFFYSGGIDLGGGLPSDKEKTIVTITGFIFLGLVVIIGFPSRYIFSISLIKNRKLMKFGGLAGMVGIWVAVFSTLTVIYFAFFPDTSIGDSIIPIFKITFKVLVGLMLIFESMVLWKAPKV